MCPIVSVRSARVANPCKLSTKLVVAQPSIPNTKFQEHHSSSRAHCIYRWCTGDMTPPPSRVGETQGGPPRLVIFPTAMSVNLIGRPPSRQAGTVSLAKCFLFYRWLNVGEAQRGPP